jgi:hypothetical protein
MSWPILRFSSAVSHETPRKTTRNVDHESRFPDGWTRSVVCRFHYESRVCLVPGKVVQLVFRKFWFRIPEGAGSASPGEYRDSLHAHRIRFKYEYCDHHIWTGAIFLDTHMWQTDRYSLARPLPVRTLTNFVSCISSSERTETTSHTKPSPFNFATECAVRKVGEIGMGSSWAGHISFWICWLFRFVAPRYMPE